MPGLQPRPVASWRQQCFHCLHYWEVGRVATLTIRNVEPELQKRLRVRAARNGRSMEAELRQILREALNGQRSDSELNLAEAIRRRFAPLGGVELELPPREVSDSPPDFDQ